MVLDSGATCSVIKSDVIKKLGLEHIIRKSDSILSVADSNPLKVMGKILLPIRLGSTGKPIPHEFVVVSKLETDALLGEGFFDENHCTMCWKDKTLRITHSSGDLVVSMIKDGYNAEKAELYVEGHGSVNVISENMTENNSTIQKGPSPTEGEDEPEIIDQQIQNTPNKSAAEGPAHKELEELENVVIKITTPIQCVKKVIVPAFSEMSVMVSANVSKEDKGKPGYITPSQNEDILVTTPPQYVQCDDIMSIDVLNGRRVHVTLDKGLEMGNLHLERQEQLLLPRDLNASTGHNIDSSPLPRPAEDTLLMPQGKHETVARAKPKGKQGATTDKPQSSKEENCLESLLQVGGRSLFNSQLAAVENPKNEIQTDQETAYLLDHYSFNKTALTPQNNGNSVCKSVEFCGWKVRLPSDEDDFENKPGNFEKISETQMENTTTVQDSAKKKEQIATPLPIEVMQGLIVNKVITTHPEQYPGTSPSITNSNCENAYESINEHVLRAKPDMSSNSPITTHPEQYPGTSPSNTDSNCEDAYESINEHVLRANPDMSSNSPNTTHTEQYQSTLPHTPINNNSPITIQPEEYQNDCETVRAVKEKQGVVNRDPDYIEQQESTETYSVTQQEANPIGENPQDPVYNNPTDNRRPTVGIPEKGFDKICLAQQKQESGLETQGAAKRKPKKGNAEPKTKEKRTEISDLHGISTVEKERKERKSLNQDGNSQNNIKTKRKRGLNINTPCFESKCTTPTKMGKDAYKETDRHNHYVEECEKNHPWLKTMSIPDLEQKVKIYKMLLHYTSSPDTNRNPTRTPPDIEATLPDSKGEGDNISRKSMETSKVETSRASGTRESTRSADRDTGPSQSQKECTIPPEERIKPLPPEIKPLPPEIKPLPPEIKITPPGDKEDTMPEDEGTGLTWTPPDTKSALPDRGRDGKNVGSNKKPIDIKTYQEKINKHLEECMETVKDFPEPTEEQWLMDFLGVEEILHINGKKVIIEEGSLKKIPDLPNFAEMPIGEGQIERESVLLTNEPPNWDKDIPKDDGLDELYVEACEKDHPWLKLITIDIHDPHQKAQLYQILIRHKEAFSMNGELGRAKNILVKIRTKDEIPIQRTPYRLDHNKTNIVDKEIQKLVDLGVLRPSTSEYNSPICMVAKKKPGEWRVTQDFRGINSHMLGETYPLTQLKEICDRLFGKTHFSTFDLMHGFFQLPLHPDSMEKTAFSTPQGHWEYTTLPQGLKISPSVFQRYMTETLKPVGMNRCLCYIDDLFAFDNSFAEHLVTLDLLLSTLKGAGLKVKPSKCHLMSRVVTFLGHEVGIHGLLPDSRKSDAIRNWQIPKTKSEVRTYLGMVGYYSDFIPNFSKLVAPLRKLTKEATPFIWDEQANHSFVETKNILMSPQVMAFPELHKPYCLSTDASATAVGAVLSQVQNGVEKVIAYHSQSLTETQRVWPITARELFGVTNAMAHFRPYLKGNKVLLRVDHLPVVYLARQANLSAKFTRMVLDLSTYDIDIVYRKGCLHGDSDGLSRNPLYQEYREEFGTQHAAIRKFFNPTAEFLPRIALPEEELQNWRETLAKETNMKLFKNIAATSHGDYGSEESATGGEGDNRKTEPATPTSQGTDEKKMTTQNGITQGLADPNSFYKEISKALGLTETNAKAWRQLIHKYENHHRKTFRDVIYDKQTTDIVHLNGIKTDSPAKHPEIVALSGLLQIPIMTCWDEDRAKMTLPETNSILKTTPPKGAVLVIGVDKDGKYSWKNKDFMMPHKKSCKYNKEYVPNKDNPLEEVTLPLTGGAQEHSLERAYCIWQAEQAEVREYDVAWSIQEEFDMNRKQKVGGTWSNPIITYEDPPTTETINAVLAYGHKGCVTPTVEEMKMVQATDRYCLQWMKYINKEEKPMFSKKHFEDFKDLMVIDDRGLLVMRPKRHYSTPDAVERIVLPRAMFQYVFQALHDDFAHIGYNKLVKLLNQRFFRPKINPLLKEYVAQCTLCYNKKGGSQRPKIPLHLHQYSHVIGDTLSLDMVGPFPKTERLNTYLLTVTCTFTRFSIAVPVINSTAPVIAQALIDGWFNMFGVPSNLHTDQGKNITGTVMQGICDSLGIRKTRTAAYTPHGNSLLERQHGVIGNLLRTVVEHDQLDWDLLVSHVMFAYRTTYHHSLDCSPYFAFFGRNPQISADVWRNTPVRGQYMIGILPSALGAETALRMRKAHRIVAAHIIKMQKYYHDAKNKGRKEHNLRETDIVWLNTPMSTKKEDVGLATKLHRRFHGPFQITEIIGPSNCEITAINSKQKQIVNVRRLRKYNPDIHDKLDHWSEVMDWPTNQDDSFTLKTRK